MGMLSEDRTGEGLATNLNIADNMTLTRLEGPARGFFVSPSRQRQSAREWIARLDIRATSHAQEVSRLSGGNQQKVALARLLHHDVDVLVLDEPTRGIDVASKAQIYKLIDELVSLRPASPSPVRGKRPFSSSARTFPSSSRCATASPSCRAGGSVTLAPRPSGPSTRWCWKHQGQACRADLRARVTSATVDKPGFRMPACSRVSRSSRSFSAFSSVPQFFSAANLELMARQTAIVCVAALGMTMVIVAGGIDLSVGSVIALSTVVTAQILRGGSWPLVAAAGAIAAGAVCGLMNGVLITGLRVVPFIITLGTMLLVRGGAKGLADERRLEAPLTWLNSMLRTVRDGSGLLLPWGIWIVILLAVMVAITLQFTRFGRHLFAIGSNERTARLCGVRVERCKIAVYAIAGAFAGLAGVMEFSRLSVGDPTVAIGAELGVIAAVIIGGGSLSGGKGTVVGTDCGRRHHDPHTDRLLAARPAELGAGDRDGHDHRVCRRS